MKINKEEIRHECAMLGLNKDYTEMVLRGRIDIDLARHLQSEDEFLCCDGLGCIECITF